MNTTIIKCGTYPIEIMVSFSKEELIKDLSKYIPTPDLDEITSILEGQAKTIMLEDNQIILYMESVPKTFNEMAILQHEIFHCVSYLMECVNIPHCEQTEEAWAYQIQYVTKEIYEKFKFSITS